MRHRLLLLALFLSSACGLADRSDLLADLRNESATTGLVLAGWRGNDVMLLPFGDEPRYLVTERTRQIKIIGVPGRMVVWLYRSSFLEHSQLFVDFTTGERVKAVPRIRAAEFVPRALNESTGRLAFWGRLQHNDSHQGVYWTSLDSAESVFVDQEVGYCDWAPDGSALTYEKAGRIYIFDVASGLSKSLVAGQNPTWSSNGRWITYRSKDGRASLITPAGEIVTWLLSSHQPTSAVRWSPDGRYVSLIERIPGRHIPLVSPSHRLVVCRVSDGAAVTVRTFGVGPASPMTFYWMLGYKNFCKDCRHGTSFN